MYRFWLWAHSSQAAADPANRQNDWRREEEASGANGGRDAAGGGSVTHTGPDAGDGWASAERAAAHELPWKQQVPDGQEVKPEVIQLFQYY